MRDGTSASTARDLVGTVFADNRLCNLAGAINREHALSLQAFRDGLNHAIAAGQLLCQAKGQLKHGEWLPWLGEHCPEISRRLAQKYMQVAAKAPHVAHLPSLRQALRELAQPDDDELSVHFSSESEEWHTPPGIIGPVVGLFGTIDVDPCAEPARRVPARHHFTRTDDGLNQEWHGCVYVNPPYGHEIEDWVDKLIYEYNAGRCSAIALVPARVDTAWWNKLTGPTLDDGAGSVVCFVRGRLKFSGHKNPAPFPSAVVYLGKSIDAFCDAFTRVGKIWVPWRTVSQAILIDQGGRA